MSRFFKCLLMVMMICAMLMMSSALASEVHHTLTFYSGSDGSFSNGSNINVVQYTEPIVQSVTKYSHTPNISDDGTQNSNYTNSFSKTEVVTIQGADSLHVVITYGGESASYDWVCMWEGSHDSYTAANNYASSITGILGGGSHTSVSNTKEYDVTGDTVTFAFKSDGSGVGDGYGYYAVVTGNGVQMSIVSGTYMEPTPSDSSYVFENWNTAINGSGTTVNSVSSLSSDTDLYAVYEEDVIAKGVYRNVSWKVLPDGTLVFGRFGEVQTFSEDGITSHPWSSYANEIASQNTIVSVRFDGDVYGTGRMDGLLAYLPHVETIDVTNFHTENVTSLASFFRWRISYSGGYYSNDLKQIIGMSNWDTSNVTDMSYMFAGSGMEALASSFKDIENWDTSKVTNMQYMFHACRYLSVDLSNWDVSNVTNMSYMFSSVTSSSDGCNLQNWDTSNVTDMSYMFQDVNFSVDMSNIDVSSVKNMAGMFKDARVEEIDLSSCNFASVEDMSGMFSATRITGSTVTVPALKNVILPGLKNVKNVAFMFRDCANLESVIMGDADLSNVTRTDYMFEGCSSLTSLDVADWDLSKVTTFSEMFKDCTSLNDIDISEWDVSSAGSFDRMFENCESLYVADISNWDMSGATTTYHMFYNCPAGANNDLSGTPTDYKNEVYNGLNWRITTDDELIFGLPGETQYVPNSPNAGTSYYYSSYPWGDYGNYIRSVKFEGIVVAGENLDAFLSFRDPSKNHHNSLIESIDFTNFDASSSKSFRGFLSGLGTYENWRKMIPVHINWANAFVNAHPEVIENFVYECSYIGEMDFSQIDWSHATDGADLFEMNSPTFWSITLPADYYDADGNALEVPSVVRYISGTDPVTGQAGRIFDSTEKWIREDRTAGPYTPEELKEQYALGHGAAMAGTWVAEESPNRFTLKFSCDYPNVIGSMPALSVMRSDVFHLPKNKFIVPNFRFKYWLDNQNTIYRDKSDINQNIYSANTVVTFRAVFEPIDRSVRMNDGSFSFRIRGNDQAIFENLPANTSYQVYEETPVGWVLVQEVDSNGLVPVNAVAEARFLNEYNPDLIRVKLTAQKYLGNDVAEPGSFLFELLDQDGNVLQTAVVSDGGAVEFEPIEYTINDIGLHHYVIRETDPNDEDIIYDNHECRVTVNITGEQELSIKYSKTPNISTSGERLSPYSYTQNQIDVVRIPGADRLHVSITYATYNGYQDYACMWLGDCSGYSTLDDVAVSITGKLGDGSMAYLRTKEYDVPGDTVTFGFHGHITSRPDYAYGYYAVVTGIRLPQAEVSYDGDRVFHNEYAPGSLVLTKMFDGDVQTDDQFWYEVQFLQESGMTYELEDAKVTYETRSGSEYDYPDLHP